MPALNILFYLLLLGLSLLILGKSSHFLVTAITRIGHHLHISQFVTGFVILGVATSTPEMFVGINSAIAGTPQLSLGNLFGANIVLLTFISGIAAVLSGGVVVKQELSHSSRLIQISMLILAPLVLLLDSHLSRLDAGFLVILYTGYLIYIYRLQPKNSPPLQKQLLDHHFFHTAFLAIAGLIGLALASKATVLSAVKISTVLGLSPVLVGTLILSLGTNLPEVSVVMAAVKQHHTNLVIGDVLGSAATNTLVIAIVALIAPFKINDWTSFQITSIFMTIALIMFFIMTRSKNRLSPLEGFTLLVLYFAFFSSEILSYYFKL